MKQLMILTGAMMLLFCGCNRRESARKYAPAKVTISKGESYETVIDKLGDPTIDSSTSSSRVMIYENFDIKLQSNIVVDVYDHR